MGKPFDLDLRLKALEMVDGGMSKTKVAQTLKIGRTTLYLWENLRKEGKLAPKKTRNRDPLKIDLKKLENYYKENSDATLQEAADFFLLGKTTIWKWLKKMKITLKKKQQNTKKLVKRKKRRLQKQLKNMNQIDSVGLMNPAYASGFIELFAELLEDKKSLKISKEKEQLVGISLLA